MRKPYRFHFQPLPWEAKSEGPLPKAFRKYDGSVVKADMATAESCGEPIWGHAAIVDALFPNNRHYPVWCDELTEIEEEIK